MRPVHTLILLTALFAGKAQAEDEVEDLRNQIEELVARNAWSGANRAYVQLDEQGVKLDDQEHYLGARASLALGRINDAVERLEAAGRHEQAQAQLASLAEAFGEVKLSVPGSHSGGIPLRSKGAMLDPLHRLVLEAAKDALEEEGTYKGLMPLGTYALGQSEFTVSADQTAKAKLK